MKLAVGDIEARQWTKFVCLVFFTKVKAKDGYDRIVRTYTGKKGVFNFLFDLEQSEEKYMLYFHNGGKYDFVFLVKTLLKHWKKNFTMTVVGSRIYEIRFAGHRLRDSFLILPTSQAVLVESFDVTRKMDIQDFDKATDQELIRRCIIDCEGLYEVIEKFQNMLDLEWTPLTLPAIAMSIFSRSHDIHRLSDEKNDWISQGYFGGRVEIFRMRGHDVRFYDINSLYPFAMLNPMPVGRGYWLNTVNGQDRILRDGEGFAEVTVKIPEMYIPPLPYRMSEKIFYPFGEWSGVYSFPFLRYIESLGCDFTMRRVLVFEREENYFKDYIDRFYKMRSEGGEAYNLIGKLFLNSLYGKFAQRKVKSKTKIAPSSAEWVIKHQASLISPKFDVWEYEVEAFIPHRTVAISAYVTSYAQIVLHTWLLRYADSVCYCDTDSIHLAGATIDTSTELGGWKLVSETPEAFYYQPKLYAWRVGDEYQFKAKGFRVKPVSIYDMGEKTFFAFPTVKEYLRKGRLQLIKKRKSMKTMYDKRRVEGDMTFAYSVKALEKILSER